MTILATATWLNRLRVRLSKRIISNMQMGINSCLPVILEAANPPANFRKGASRSPDNPATNSRGTYTVARLSWLTVSRTGSEVCPRVRWTRAAWHPKLETRTRPGITALAYTRKCTVRLQFIRPNKALVFHSSFSLS